VAVNLTLDTISYFLPRKGQLNDIYLVDW